MNTVNTSVTGERNPVRGSYGEYLEQHSLPDTRENWDAFLAASLRAAAPVTGEGNAPRDIAADAPSYSAQKSVREAWQRACDKHGEQYANDIFPDGKPQKAAQPETGTLDQQITAAHDAWLEASEQGTVSNAAEVAAWEKFDALIKERHPAQEAAQ